ncbi:MAG: hypothetical protein IMW92_11005 [Bacillales bacterium]|nr:hypothetical protein [Bacillales bacterium]
MEYIFFLSVCWCIWITATFLMDKAHPLRLKLSIASLLLCIGAGKFITIDHAEVSLSYLLLVAIGSFTARQFKFKELLSLCISALMTAMVFAGIKLFEMYERAWFLFDVKWYIVILVLLIQYAIYPKYRLWKNRMISAYMGFLAGEWLLYKVLSQVFIPYKIGDSSFLDFFSFSMLIVVGIHQLRAFKNLFHVKFLSVKEKQTYE